MSDVIPRKGVGIIAVAQLRGDGISLFRRGRVHEVVVALDLHLAILENGIVAQVRVEADVLAGRQILVAHRLGWRMSQQLVQARNGNQFIPVEPVDPADLLIAGTAEAPTEKEVVLPTVQAVPGIGAELVDELAVPAGLCAFQPAWMKSCGGSPAMAARRHPAKHAA